MIGFIVLVLTALVVVASILGVAAGLKRINAPEQPEPGSARLDQIESALSSVESRLDDLQDQQRFLERLLEARPERPSLGSGEAAADTDHGNASDDDASDPDASDPDARDPDAPGRDPERSILFDLEPEGDR